MTQKRSDLLPALALCSRSRSGNVFLGGLAHSEESGLRRSDFHRRRASLIVIGDVIDPATHCVRAHQTSMIRLQQISQCATTLNLLVQDHRHAVVDRRCCRVRRCGEDRTRSNLLPAWVSPALPQSRECEQPTAIDFETKWLFRRTTSPPFVKSVRWNQTSSELHSVTKRGQEIRVLRRVLSLAVEWRVIESAPKLALLPGEPHRGRVVTPGPLSAGWAQFWAQRVAGRIRSKERHSAKSKRTV
jgi:hypothetical protein